MRLIAKVLSRSETWLALAIVLGLAIRLYRLDARSIWFDETTSWRTCQFPVPEMLERVAADIHPPLYFLCLKGWMGLFGDSLWALRGLSVAFSGVLIVGTYLFVSVLHENADGNYGKWPAATTALLVAFSPFQIRMAWEARMYMLGAALAVVSSWLLLVAWRRRDSLRLWFAYGASASLLGYTHYYALFTIFAQFLFLTTAILLQHRTRLSSVDHDSQMRGALVGASVVVVGWLPWLSTFLAQRHRVDMDWWTGPFRWSTLLGVSQTIFTGQWGVGYLAQVSAGVIAIVVIALLAQKNPLAKYLALLIVCPIVLSTAYSFHYRNIVIDRCFVFTQVFVLCGLVTLLSRISDRVIRNAIAALLVAWSVFGYFDMWSELDIQNHPGAQGAAKYIVEHADAEDQVIVSSSMIYYPMLYHLSSDIGCRLLQSEPLAHYAGGTFSKPEDFITMNAMADLQNNRAWVVTGGWDDRPVPIPAHWALVRSASFREVFEFQGQVTVDEYRMKRGTVTSTK
jgi:uncharacterized membrane protein